MRENMRENFDYAAKWAGVTVLYGGLTLTLATNDAPLAGVATSVVAGLAGYKALKSYFAGVEELHHESTKPIESIGGEVRDDMPVPPRGLTGRSIGRLF